MNGVKTTPADVMELSSQRVFAAVTTLAGGGAALLLASAAGNGLNYLFGMFIARALGAETFGLYALGLTLFNVLALFAPLALDVAVIKFVSGQLASGERDLARRTVIRAGAIAGLSGLLAAAGLAACAPWLAASLYHKPALSGVLWWLAAALPFAALTPVLLRALQSFQTVRYTVWIKYLWEPAGKFLLAALAVGLGWGLTGVLGAIVVALAVSSLAALGCARRLFPQAGNGPDHGGASFTALLAFSGPLIVSNAFSILAPRSDILMLGYWVDADQVGIYSAAFQTSAVIALVLGAFDTAAAPMLGNLISRGDHGTLKILYQVTARWALTVTAPLFVLMAVLSHDILALFGSAFTLGATCLLLLAAAQAVNAATGTTTSMILMSGRSRMIMIDAIVMGVLLIGLNVILVPRYGILGAAIAAAACQIVVSLIRVVQVWQVQRILPVSRSMIKPFTAAAVAMGIGLMMKGRLASDPVSQWVLAAIVCSVFGGLLFLFGFDRDDTVTASEIWKRRSEGVRRS